LPSDPYARASFQSAAHNGLFSEAFDLQPLDVLEVLAVIAQKCELMLAGRHADQEIEVGDTFSLGAQAAALSSEEPGGLLIDVDDG
jgi:hypothetical protein